MLFTLIFVLQVVQALPIHSSSGNFSELLNSYDDELLLPILMNGSVENNYDDAGLLLSVNTTEHDDITLLQLDRVKRRVWCSCCCQLRTVYSCQQGCYYTLPMCCQRITYCARTCTMPQGHRCCYQRCCTPHTGYIIRQKRSLDLLRDKLIDTVSIR
ncbi:hypothetical protein Tcan_10299 [Toxocara canis]|uniref:Uncharacterized protein n=1 Tax=Toxocara canis TaxID=6265 RepID=A0A0B2W040_TOXCA|nr:hypothetical protein Tcan_10299 [Toxocara canis]